MSTNSSLSSIFSSGPSSFSPGSLGNIGIQEVPTDPSVKKILEMFEIEPSPLWRTDLASSGSSFGSSPANRVNVIFPAGTAAVGSSEDTFSDEESDDSVEEVRKPPRVVDQQLFSDDTVEQGFLCLHSRNVFDKHFNEIVPEVPQPAPSRSFYPLELGIGRAPRIDLSRPASSIEPVSTPVEPYRRELDGNLRYSRSGLRNSCDGEDSSLSVSHRELNENLRDSRSGLKNSRDGEDSLLSVSHHRAEEQTTPYRSETDENTDNDQHLQFELDDL